MEVGKGIKLEEKEIDNVSDSGAKVKQEHGECIGCSELQDKIKKANDKCARLELNIKKKNFLTKYLHGKVESMELANPKIMDEVSKLKQRNEELEKSIRDSEEEREKFTDLMIENEVLGCEKQKAETDVEFWKSKCKELEVRVMELEKRLGVGATKAGADLHDMCSGEMMNRDRIPPAVQTETKIAANHGTPPISTPSEHCADIDGFKGGRKCEIKSTVKKCLDFDVGRSPLHKFSPSTPGSRPPLEPINIVDSDDDVDTVHLPSPDLDSKEQSKVQMSNGVALESPDVVESPLKNMHEPNIEDQSDEEEEASCSSAGKPFRMAKRRKVRKGVAQIVTSESESDDDIPLSRRRSMKACNPDTQSEEDLTKLTPRRRLRRVGDTKDNSVPRKCSQRSAGNQSNIGTSENMNDTLLEDEIEGDESSSEGESLGGFIVESTDESDCDSGSNGNDMSEHDGSLSGDCSDESESASEGNIKYDEIISSLRRGRKDKRKWEYESDMLADFGKSAELCMKAICALYRQQTSEEKSSKATIHRNGRGFNQIHAYSGSALAEFLTDGDPHADTNKTVEELQKFNSKGVEQCRKLANHYSKQLFEIYKNEEDPFFHP